MREFFRGWRRKLGCVVLAVAMASSCLWARSWFAFDQVGFVFDGRQYEVFSVDGMLLGHSVELDINETGYDDWRVGTIAFDPWAVRILFHVLRFGEHSKQNVPHWSIVLPLTLLSAYLLLWKPRKRTGPDHA